MQTNRLHDGRNKIKVQSIWLVVARLVDHYELEAIETTTLPKPV